MHTYYEIHPLATLFPEMPEDQFSALVADVQANGQQEPGLLFENKLIDGRHRQKACQLLNLPFVAKHYRPDDNPTHDEALNAIVSQNLLRRHMTTSERAYMAAKIANAKRGGKTRRFSLVATPSIENADTDKTPEITTNKDFMDSPQTCGEIAETHSAISTLNHIAKLLISLKSHPHTNPNLQQFSTKVQSLINDLQQ